jgi:hypothetical protein
VLIRSHDNHTHIHTPHTRAHVQVGGDNKVYGDQCLDALRRHYFDSEEVYRKVLVAKRKYDPDDVFTPNEFCVGASKKFGTAQPGDLALTVA